MQCELPAEALEDKWLDLICADVSKIITYIDVFSNVESLYLTGCELEDLPKGIGNLRNLKL